MRDYKLLFLCLSVCAQSLCAFTLSGCNESSRGIGDSNAGDSDAGDPDASHVHSQCDVEPLSEFCTGDTDCPSTLHHATASWCSTAPTTTDLQNNSCGGESVLYSVGLGTTQYHYDEDGRLVGVRQLTDAIRGCSEGPNAEVSSEYRYGRECTLSGTASPACGGPCPDIACVAGAVFDADWPFDFEETQEAPITICRNDECFTGMLEPTMGAPGPDVGFGFTVPESAVMDRDQTGQASVTFWGERGGGVYLRVHWTPWSNAELADGDRYRVTAEVLGDTRVLIDHEVEYGTNELGSGACFQSCPYVNVNLRSLTSADGGVDDDAGQ